jgi:hypothetical protein
MLGDYPPAGGESNRGNPPPPYQLGQDRPGMFGWIDVTWPQVTYQQLFSAKRRRATRSNNRSSSRERLYQPACRAPGHRCNQNPGLVLGWSRKTFPQTVRSIAKEVATSAAKMAMTGRNFIGRITTIVGAGSYWRGNWEKSGCAASFHTWPGQPLGYG